MKTTRLFSVLAALTLLHLPLGFAHPVEDTTGGPDFRERFLHPPAEARILKIIHGWPDEAADQDALIRGLGTQGFGGVVCNVSFTDYLQNETKWKSFTRAVQAARQAGFALWLYDEKGYPSGNAGGLVLKDHPEWEAEGLLVADSEAAGGTVTLDVPPGKPVWIGAFAVRDGAIDLTARTNLEASVKDGRITWPVPPGRWRVMAITQSHLFEGTHAALNLAAHIPYLNLLDAAPTARFLELTHQRYAEHLGGDLGQWFVSTFTDEPSLMSLFLKPMPYRVLPWSRDLPAEFKKRRGYAVEELIPALVADAGPSGRRARYDFWRTIGEMVSENYFGQIQQWCAAHQVRSGGHLLMEENLLNHVPLYGDFFACLRRLDAPSIDCLTSLPEQVPWFIARLAGSAADLEQRPITMCETSDHSQRYRPAGDKRPVVKVSEAQIRGTCNRLMVGGIDTITSYYSFDGLSNEELRRLNDWVGRCCMALKGGCQVADIAVLYPVESVWPRFTPARHYANDSAAAAQIETIYHDVSDGLFAAGRDFTYVDGRALAEAKVQDGVLVHGGLRWRVVVLPGADTLSLAAWENLERFVRGGGVLIAIGTLPKNSQIEFPSPRVEGMAAEIFGPTGDQPRALGNARGGGGIFLPAGSAGLLPAVLKALLEPDVKAGGPSAPLRSTHRRINGRDVYFVINDSDQPWRGEISVCATGTGEFCDPATGQIRSLLRPTGVLLDLPAYGGAILQFAESRLPKKSRLDTGALPGLSLRHLPEVAPQLARGEFVRETMARDTEDSPSDRPAWRVAATLTKGQVDTFLFARFAYPEPLDLSAATCLVLDTWVPAGQQTANQLLVILHQKNGADYLVSTGRLLGAPGHSQNFLPLSRFQLAGWSNDPGHHLDLSNITEIRVGWGGYYGTEGEQVQFTLAPPQIAAEAGAR